MRRTRDTIRCLLLGLATLMAVPAVASGDRWVFPVAEPFRIGDELFAAGELSVRVLHDFTPVRSVHDFRVGDRHVGMLMVERGHGEAPSSGTVAVFHRGPDGLLSLVGYATPGGKTGVSYRLAAVTVDAGTVTVAAR